jgi:hypothetical protein
MRKLVLTLVALIAVVTFIRAYDISAVSPVDSSEIREASTQVVVER